MRSLFNDSFYDLFFFNWPKEAKPPIEQIPFRNEDGSLDRLEIQMALAGFEQKDVSVDCDDKLLYVSGSNENKKEILDRFKCSFSYQIPYSEKLDMKNAEIILENGLLRIVIPAADVKKTRVRLFGSDTLH